MRAASDFSYLFAKNRQNLFILEEFYGKITVVHFREVGALANNRLLLVDGHNLLFQMFFGMPSRILSKNGKPIHGTLGFVGALLRMIRMTSPTHIAVLFDGEHENERASLDPAYKSDRPDYSELPSEETPFSQLSDIYAALDFLNIRHTEITDYETDDAIAAYTFALPDKEIVIASFDSDYFQLISEKISVLRYRGDKTILCDRAYIREKFCIEPTQYADFKCLVGDTSDCIRGVPGIGPKTAAALLQDYHTLDGILCHIEMLKRESLRSALQANAERILLNRSLIKLDDRAALPFAMEEMACPSLTCTTKDILCGIGLAY